MECILVIAEHRKQALADVSLQALSKGRDLADLLRVPLIAVVIGKNGMKLAAELAKWADTVIINRSNGLEQPLAGRYQTALSPILNERKPGIILMGHSAFSMELAPSLAVALKSSLATDCIDISLDGGSVQVTRSIYNGKIQAVHSFAPDSTAVITVRAGQFPVRESNRQGSIEEMDFTVEENPNKKYEGYKELETVGVDITQADILISIGRGIKDRKNIETAEKLAGLLGGVVSCSRPVVDYGWLPAERQVGLSGKTVRPKLYLAIGISGAFQHVVGMKEAKMVVAINKNIEAPIFTIAHYAIVDDMVNVLPVLIRKIAELKN